MTQIDALRMALTSCLTACMFSAFAADSTPAKNDQADQNVTVPAAKTETKAVGAWQLTCNSAQTSKKNDCVGILRITQQVAEGADKETQKNVTRVVLAWIISKAPNGKMMTSIETPSGVLIQPGVQLNIDKSSPKTIPFMSCNPQFCVATTEMNDAFVKQASAATKVEMKIQSPTGKAFTYSFEPNGIKDVIKAIQ